ncbi:hypothetical protein HAX54_020064, partial [Datura stramonium]|nr:hypothetical protein [Datura stramonium]
EDPTSGNTIIFAIYVGGLDGHWSSFPRFYSLSPSPNYEPPIVFDAYRNNEEGGALERLSAKLTQMIAETTTCNNLQVTVLANTQEEPKVEGRIEIRQEMDQFSSSIHDRQGLLIEKFEAYEAQLHSVGDTNQCMEQEGESESLDYSLLVDVNIEE